MSSYNITNRPGTKLYLLNKITEQFEGYIAGLGGNNKLSTFMANAFADDQLAELQNTPVNINEEDQTGNNNKKIIGRILDGSQGGFFAKDYLGNSLVYADSNIKKPGEGRVGLGFDLYSVVSDDESLKFVGQECGSQVNRPGSALDCIKEFNGETPNSFNFDSNNPSLENPGIAGFVIKNRNYNMKTRNSNYLSMFFNGIPLIEMSRCAPFISITFFNENFDKSERKHMNPVYHMRFVKKGENFVLDDNAGLANSTMIDGQNRERRHTDENFMSIFTSPQTMANANINVTNAGAGDLLSVNPNRPEFNHEKYLEPIVPLLTLTNIQIAIDGMGHGLVSSRKGTMSLVLHDRSRLKDFGPIVSLNQLSTTSMRLEFGWSHPDGNPLTSDNLIGQFLNANRDVQYYILTSSDLKFNNNSVDINLKMVDVGLQHTRAVPAAAGFHAPLSILGPKINRIIEGIIRRRSKEKFFDERPELLSTLKVIKTTSNSLMEIVDRQDYLDLLKHMRNNSPDYILLRKSAELLGLLPRSEEPEGAPIGDEEKEIKRILEELSIETEIDNTGKKEKTARLIENKRKQAEIDTLSDPYIDNLQALTSEFHKSFDESAADQNQEGQPADGRDPILLEVEKIAQKSTSFGRLMHMFVGSPLLSTGQYSEIQLFFYPINDKAAGARRHTTASFPIPNKIIEKALEEALKVNSNPNIKSMFKILSDLVEDATLPVYRLQDRESFEKEFYGEKNKEEVEEAAFADYNAENGKNPSTDAEKEAAIQTYISKNAKIKRQETLEEIYNSDAMGQVEKNAFVRPDLRMETETLPVIALPEQAGDNGAGNLLANLISDFREFFSSETIKPDYAGSDKILRVHIYDRQATSNAKASFLDKIMADYAVPKAGATDESEAGGDSYKIVKNKMDGSLVAFRKMPISQIKNFVKRSFPSITWGASTSTVKSLSVSSNTSDTVSQMVMIRRKVAERTGNVSKSMPDVEEEVSVNPAAVDVQLMGCPFIKRGDEIFIDFGTGTNLDNVYGVNAVTHTIKSGEFTTSLSVVLLGQGRVSNTRVQIADRIKAAMSEKET